MNLYPAVTVLEVGSVTVPEELIDVIPSAPGGSSVLRVDLQAYTEQLQHELAEYEKAKVEWLAASATGQPQSAMNSLALQAESKALKLIRAHQGEVTLDEGQPTARFSGQADLHAFQQLEVESSITISCDTDGAFFVSNRSGVNLDLIDWNERVTLQPWPYTARIQHHGFAKSTKTYLDVPSHDGWRLCKWSSGFNVQIAALGVSSVLLLWWPDVPPATGLQLLPIMHLELLVRQAQFASLGYKQVTSLDEARCLAHTPQLHTSQEATAFSDHLNRSLALEARVNPQLGFFFTVVCVRGGAKSPLASVDLTGSDGRSTLNLVQSEEFRDRLTVGFRRALQHEAGVTMAACGSCSLALAVNVHEPNTAFVWNRKWVEDQWPEDRTCATKFYPECADLSRGNFTMQAVNNAAVMANSVVPRFLKTHSETALPFAANRGGRVTYVQLYSNTAELYRRQTVARGGGSGGTSFGKLIFPSVPPALRSVVDTGVVPKPIEGPSQPYSDRARLVKALSTVPVHYGACFASSSNGGKPAAARAEFNVTYSSFLDASMDLVTNVAVDMQNLCLQLQRQLDPHSIHSPLLRLNASMLAMHKSILFRATWVIIEILTLYSTGFVRREHAPTLPTVLSTAEREAVSWLLVAANSLLSNRWPQKWFACKVLKQADESGLPLDGIIGTLSRTHFVFPVPWSLDSVGNTVTRLVEFRQSEADVWRLANTELRQRIGNVTLKTSFAWMHQRLAKACWGQAATGASHSVAETTSSTFRPWCNPNFGAPGQSFSTETALAYIACASYDRLRQTVVSIVDGALITRAAARYAQVEPLRTWSDRQNALGITRTSSTNGVALLLSFLETLTRTFPRASQPYIVRFVDPMLLLEAASVSRDPSAAVAVALRDRFAIRDDHDAEQPSAQFSTQLRLAVNKSSASGWVLLALNSAVTDDAPPVVPRLASLRNNPLLVGMDPQRHRGISDDADGYFAVIGLFTRRVLLSKLVECKDEMKVRFAELRGIFLVLRMTTHKDADGRFRRCELWQHCIQVPVFDHQAPWERTLITVIATAIRQTGFWTAVLAAAQQSAGDEVSSEDLQLAVCQSPKIIAALVAYSYAATDAVVEFGITSVQRSRFLRRILVDELTRTTAFSITLPRVSITVWSAIGFVIGLSHRSGRSFISNFEPLSVTRTQFINDVREVERLASPGFTVADWTVAADQRRSAGNPPALGILRLLSEQKEAVPLSSRWPPADSAQHDMRWAGELMILAATGRADREELKEFKKRMPLYFDVVVDTARNCLPFPTWRLDRDSCRGLAMWQALQGVHTTTASGTVALALRLFFDLCVATHRLSALGNMSTTRCVWCLDV